MPNIRKAFLKFMWTEQQTKNFEPLQKPCRSEGELGFLFNRFKAPVTFCITDHSNAVLLIWLSVFACYVSISVVFLHYMCLDDI